VSDDEYDDTPYRDAKHLTPVLTVSVDQVDEANVNSDLWVYVDEADTRIARQRFTSAEFYYSDAYERWLGVVLGNSRLDPEGQEQCGDCGNWVGHAPDCRYYRWTNPAELRY